jgi:hypothetical protein
MPDTATLEEPIALADVFGPTSLEVADLKIEFGVWCRLGENLQKMETSLPWWSGDWLVYGEDHFGEEHAQGLDFAYDQKTLANHASVSRKIPPKHRDATLSWAHHRVAAGLPTIKLITKALKQAVRENLSSRDLQSVVTAMKSAGEDPERQDRTKGTKAFEIRFSVDLADEHHGKLVADEAMLFVQKQLTERGVDLTNESIRVH